jgi:hypothetical protein
MLVEVKAIFEFVPRFDVSLRVPANIPAKIDMTDSIVKLVVDDGDVTLMKNQADQREEWSIRAGIQKLNLRVRMPDFTRYTDTDIGGVGWHAKSVLALGTTKVTIVPTGGVVSIAFAADAALTFTAPNSWDLNWAKQRYEEKIKGAKLAHGEDQARKVKAAEASYEKSKQHWKLKDIAPKNWPPEMQKQMSLALGRSVAHEARHQFIGPHFDEGGLGGGSQKLLGVATSERFLEGDSKQILDKILKFERDQLTANLHIETFPQGDHFAFAELR